MVRSIYFFILRVFLIYYVTLLLVKLLLFFQLISSRNYTFGCCNILLLDIISSRIFMLVVVDTVKCHIVYFLITILPFIFSTLSHSSIFFLSLNYLDLLLLFLFSYILILINFCFYLFLSLILLHFYFYLSPKLCIHSIKLELVRRQCKNSNVC